MYYCNFAKPVDRRTKMYRYAATSCIAYIIFLLSTGTGVIASLRAGLVAPQALPEGAPLHPPTLPGAPVSVRSGPPEVNRKSDQELGHPLGLGWTRTLITGKETVFVVPAVGSVVKVSTHRTKLRQCKLSVLSTRSGPSGAG
jgi:hypothetical protein